MSATTMFPAFTPEVITGSEEKRIQVVFLTAEWCGSCVILEHIVNKLRQGYEPEIKFYKADYDTLEAWANKYGIYAPPALVYAWNREVVDKDEGTLSGQEVVRKLDDLTNQYLTGN